MLPVSAYIITLNEAHNLPRLLTQLSEFQEVIIVDSDSEDDTVKIASQYSNVKVSYHPWSGFSAQKAHALSLCSSEWVFNIDADEELTDELLAEIRKTVEENECDALQCRRTLLHWGKAPRNFVDDDVILRLFRKSAGHYEPVRVHERISIEGRVRSTEASLLHHENLTFGQRMSKSNVYSDLKAKDKFEKGHTVHGAVLTLIFPWTFIQIYLFKGNFMDGFNGLLRSMNCAYYSFMKYAKLWELNKEHSVVQAGTHQTKAGPSLRTKS